MDDRFGVYRDKLSIYDSHTDEWFTFDTVEKLDAFLNSFTRADERDQSEQRVVFNGAPAFNAWSLRVDNTSNGMPFDLVPIDLQRRRVRVKNDIGGKACLIGTRQGLSASANPQGYLLDVGESIEIEISSELYALCVGNATIIYMMTLSDPV